MNTPDLFNTAGTFALRGEPLDNSVTAEGEARARAEAESAARHEQREFRMYIPDKNLDEFMRSEGITK